MRPLLSGGPFSKAPRYATGPTDHSRTGKKSSRARDTDRARFQNLHSDLDDNDDSSEYQLRPVGAPQNKHEAQVSATSYSQREGSINRLSADERMYGIEIRQEWEVKVL